MRTSILCGFCRNPLTLCRQPLASPMPGMSDPLNHVQHTALAAAKAPSSTTGSSGIDAQTHGMPLGLCCQSCSEKPALSCARWLLHVLLEDG